LSDVFEQEERNLFQQAQSSRPEKAQEDIARYSVSYVGWEEEDEDKREKY